MIASVIFDIKSSLKKILQLHQNQNTKFSYVLIFTLDREGKDT